MKSLLIPMAVLTLVLAACGQEPAKPVAPAAQPAPKAAPATPPAAPAGAMTQEEKEKMAKDLTDAAKSAVKKGE
jgi:hypothetical protein